MTKQEIWDDILIRAWFKDVPMYLCIEQLRANGVDIPKDLKSETEVMAMYLRAPQRGNDIYRKTARTFIGVTMPWLSNYLWENSESDPSAFIKKLSQSKYTIEKQCQNLRRARSREVKKQGYEEFLTAPHAVADDPNHDWRKVKAVRSKHG